MSNKTEWNDKDGKNIAAIKRAFDEGRIDLDTKNYLDLLYGNGMHWFREMFYILGKSLGAPKTAVFHFDASTGQTEGQPIKINDINPGDSYIVQHRLDVDSMRNQFFQFNASHDVELAVSSIVTVIVAAQKNVNRAIEKIIGPYYDAFTDEVIATVQRVLSLRANDASARAIADKIKKRFAEKYITNAAQEVLSAIGRGHEGIAVELVREVDKIARPQHRLRDVYRMKCLLDMVPQVRTFIDKITMPAPEKVIDIRDKFYNTSNARNYRDAKVVLNIGSEAEIVPLEIICQVRTFFDFERQSHNMYETERSKKSTRKDSDIAVLHESGIKEYNIMVRDCLRQLFDRIGWNILYSRADGISETLFDGFPKISVKFYPPEIIDNTVRKLKNNVKNEIFKVEDAPRKLSPAEQLEIFEYMAKFILSAALPYTIQDWKLEGDDVETKLFNFVMTEVHRFHKSGFLPGHRA